MDYYFYNTDAGSLLGPPRPRFDRLIQQHVAVTGGARRFGRQLQQLAPGDALLMYENGTGIVAVGEVVERWDGKSYEDLLYYEHGDVCRNEEGHECEYRIRVDWVRGRQISVQELRKRLGYTPSGPAVQQIRERRAEAEAIVTEVQVATPAIREAVDLRIPDRVATSTWRIIRDTQLTRRVKALHAYECQICGHTIKLPDGSCYAEAHHIQPLGAPHNGPDVMGNVVCVCPNHHAELDLGAIAINLAALRRRTGHSIEPKYVQYHNREVYRGSGKRM